MVEAEADEASKENSDSMPNTECLGAGMTDSLPSHFTGGPSTETSETFGAAAAARIQARIALYAE